MIFVKRIPAKKVKSLAKKMVKRADKSLLVTMLMAEELKSPLPKSYHDLILKKTRKDHVLVNRIGFGKESEFKKLSKIFDYKSKLFNFFYLKNIKLYQRMLIRDKKEAIFALNLNKNKKVYFYSNYQPLVESLVAYFVYLSKRVYIKKRRNLL